MTRRIKRLAVAPTVQIPEATLRDLIASLERDHSTLLEIAADMRPRMMKEVHAGTWSNLHHLIDNLKRYATTLKNYVPRP